MKNFSTPQALGSVNFVPGCKLEQNDDERETQMYSPPSIVCVVMDLHRQAKLFGPKAFEKN